MVCTWLTGRSAREPRASSEAGSVLERAYNQIGAFGNPVLSAVRVLLVQREALRLKVARHADHVADEDKGGAFAVITMNEPTCIEAAQCEHHAFDLCKPRARPVDLCSC